MYPPDFISRRPRKISGNIGHLKANELRSWILYYALPCLKDILPETHWNHLSLLVEGLHIILSDSITTDDITEARKYFRTFYKDFSKLYEHNLGKCGLNVHNLYHLCDYVEWWGPAWCWSCFGFESLNGEVLKRVHGTKNTTKQILLRFAAIKEVREKLLSSKTRDVVKSFLGSLTHGDMKRGWVLVSREISVSGFLDDGVYSCYRRGHLVIKGTRYKRSTKAINSVVLVIVDSKSHVFRVESFTVDEDQVYFNGKLLHIRNESIAPRVVQTSRLAVVDGESDETYKVNADLIKEKLLMLDGNEDFKCISRLPNHFESD
ncbi:uncharacterized protein [Clytia hemisphaerica]|uniref:uncharacterized protein n=1 Tax=Clytia hemisphaerica TaxID=252671 RepID=UPI0034D66C78